MRFTLPVLLAASLLAAPGLAQQAPPSADTQTPRGTYLVYADEQGAAFVSVEGALATTNVWPLSFFYFVDGAIAGSARMAGSGDCGQGLVRGRLTDATGADGAALPLPQGEATPSFAFDRAGGGGDEAIVSFVCGDTEARLIQAETPVFAEPRTVADRYRRLREAGLADRLARSLAIRDAGASAGLVASAVPEAQRVAVNAILRGN